MKRSFDDVFEAEFSSLHRYLARRLGGEGADELTAETFIVALRKWPELDSRPARPWLYGIAANLVKHRWRTEQRMLRAYARTGLDATSEDDDVSVDRLDASAAGPRLAAALEALRPVEREVLLLHAWAELTDQEIAAALSLPLGTVKSHLSRSRSHLRNHLSDIGRDVTEQHGPAGGDVSNDR